MFMLTTKKLSVTVLLASKSKNPLLNRALVTEYIAATSHGAVRGERRVGRIFAALHICTSGGNHRAPAGQQL